MHTWYFCQLRCWGFSHTPCTHRGVGWGRARWGGEGWGGVGYGGRASRSVNVSIVSIGKDAEPPVSTGGAHAGSIHKVHWPSGSQHQLQQQQRWGRRVVPGAAPPTAAAAPEGSTAGSSSSSRGQHCR